MAAALQPGPCAVHLKSWIVDCQPSMMKVPCTNNLRQNVHSFHLATTICNDTVKGPTDCLRLEILAYTEWYSSALGS